VLETGNLQTGVLLVNVAQITVENNSIHVGPKPPGFQIGDLIKNNKYRAKLIKRLVSNSVMGTKPPAGGVTNAKIEFGGRTILFGTPPILKDVWQTIVATKPPTNVTNDVQLLNYLHRAAEQVLTDASFRAAAPKISQWFNGLLQADVAVASQGIVVGGQVAKELRILNNTIQGVLQGIHVGTSHRVPQTTPPTIQTDTAGTVTISDNTIVVLLTQDSFHRQRHGVFAGNCESLLVENNRITLQRVAGTDNIQVSGAIAHGFLGRKVVLRHNYLAGFNTGVEFFPRFPYPPVAQVLWLMADNLFQGVVSLVKFPPAPHGNPPLDQPGNKSAP
jgi:hypothetical protein